MEGRRTHRRCRSEGGALAEGAALSHWDVVQSNVSSEGHEYPGTVHIRTVSLDTSASQFMQSLALSEAQGSQQQLKPRDAELPASNEQQSNAFSIRPHAALSPKFAGAHGAIDAWRDGAEAAATAGVKRSHESSKGSSRSAKGAAQQDGKKENLHQHKHSFTPALPAVDEIKAEDAYDAEDRDDDEDYDSDSMATPRARRSSGSRSRARRGGYNGRSENELLLLDPKRVKRILANRQSAARSKERRMNYTMQLEGKLHSLGQEVDKLNAQIEGLQGQSKALLQARTELEQHVESMQFQLSRTTADNQLLIKELFGLQRSLGLPQGLPQPDTASAGSHAVPGQPQAAQQYDLAVQQYGPQQHGALQQHSQWQQYDGTGGHAEYPGAAAANAAAVEPAHMVGKLPYHHQQHSSRSSNSSIGYQTAAELAELGRGLSGAPPPAAGGTGMPPLPPNGRSPGSHAIAPTAVAVADKDGHLAQMNNQCLPCPPAAAGITAMGGGFRSGHNPQQLANATRSSEAAVAADALLLDASAGGDDAAMTNVDDLEMLSVLLDDDLPVQDSAAATQTGVLRHPSTDHQQQQQQQQPLYLSSSNAAADYTIRRQSSAVEQFAGSFGHPAAAAVAAGPQQPASIPSFKQPAPLGTLGPSHSQPNLSQQHALALNPGPRSWSSQSSPGTGVAVASGVPPALLGPRPHASNLNSNHAMAHHPRVLCSPAYSDPVGEGFADDVSSGSMGGSITPSMRHARMSESLNAAAAAVPAAAAAAAAAVPFRQQGLGALTNGAWQQQEQVLSAVSPCTPGTGSATAAAAVAPAGAHACGVGHIQPHANVNPTDAQHAAVAPPYVAYHQRHSSDVSSIATVSSTSTLAAAGSSAAAAAAALGDPAQLNFTMGVNPAARHRRSASYGGAIGHHHHRSASTGSSTGLAGLEGLDRHQHWLLQGLGSLGPSSAAATAGDAAFTPGVHTASPFQQQQHFILTAGAGFGPVSLGNYSNHPRISTPAGVTVGMDHVHSAAGGGAGVSSGLDRLAYPGHGGMEYSGDAGSRLPQHRRSCSHAGTYGSASLAAAAAVGSGDVLQHMDHHIHPAALGPGAASSAVDAAAVPGLPVFSEFGTAAGVGTGGSGGGGSDVHASVYGPPHARLVTTRHAAAPAGAMHT